MRSMDYNRKKVVVFLAIVVFLGLFSYIPVISDHTLKGNDLYILFLMWTPALAAIITKLIFDRNLKDMGWGLGKPKYMLYSYIIPLGACLVVYSLVWLSGIGGVDLSKMGRSKPGELIITLFMFSTVGVLASGLSAAGEEIGWRGFLVPELLKKYSYVKTSLIMGVIWNIYHYPLILFSDYNNGTSKVASLICFTISVFAICFITTHLRIQSGSLWTGVLLHASHNLFVPDIFDRITLEHGYTKLFTTEFGIGLAVVYALIAIYIVCNRRKNNV